MCETCSTRKAGPEERQALVDVRSPGEYTGELLHMANYPQEGALRGGHIPGAAQHPVGAGRQEDGTFKPADELRALYEGKGVTRTKTSSPTAASASAAATPGSS